MTPPCSLQPAPGLIHLPPSSPRRYGLAIAPNGRTLFFADSRMHRIVEVDGYTGGALVGSWGRHGVAPGELDHPRGLTIHGSELIVADRGNHRLQVTGTHQHGRARSGSSVLPKDGRAYKCTFPAPKPALRAFPPQNQPCKRATHKQASSPNA